MLSPQNCVDSVVQLQGINKKSLERFAFSKRSKNSSAKYPGEVEKRIASLVKVSCPHNLSTIRLSDNRKIEVCEFEKPLQDDLTFEYQGRGPIVFIPIVEKNESIWNDGEIFYLESPDSHSVLVAGELSAPYSQNHSEFNFIYSGLDPSFKDQLFLDSLADELTFRLNGGHRFIICNLDIDTAIALACISKLRIHEKFHAAQFLNISATSDLDQGRLNWQLKYLFGTNFRKFISSEGDLSFSAQSFFTRCTPQRKESLARKLNSNGDLVPQSFLNESVKVNPS